MVTGLGLLRLPPAVFWAMTPRELASALQPLTGPMTASPVPSRRDLEQLMQRFPDVECVQYLSE